MSMPRRLPPHVERNRVKNKNYYYFRKGKGARIRLPDYGAPEFNHAYAAALAGQPKPAPKRDRQGTIGALIQSYLRSSAFIGLRQTSKAGYMRRLDRIRQDHGHRTVDGLTRQRIISAFLEPYACSPGAALDTLKKLRILIRHAMDLGQLQHDPSIGIKRQKTKEVRAWFDAELAAFEARWPIGTKQRAAYELMLNAGPARADVHRVTWTQIDNEGFQYTRQKTGVPVAVAMAASLRAAFDALPRNHVTIINTEFGKPFTVDGFSGFMRDAIKAAGITDLSCRPHGLRKTFGRLLADAGASAHDIMAAMGHITLAEAQRYTREADRRRGGRRAIVALEDHKANKLPQTPSESLGSSTKNKGRSI
jgi:integrase